MGEDFLKGLEKIAGQVSSVAKTVIGAIGDIKGDKTQGNEKAVTPQAENKTQTAGISGNTVMIILAVVAASALITKWTRG